MNAPARWCLQRGEDGYPFEFEDLPDPPELLYGYGDPDLLGGGLAVIGSRRATPYGLACSRRFSGWAASNGIPVVSGAAIGCDLESHRAALAVDGPTVAVLPCGADVDYPRRASATLSEMRRRGVVISEAPWGTDPKRWSFVRRNRLIAALSRAVLVVEAGLPSGTFTTADHALDIGRQVFAVPGSILAPECRGSNRLIRQGAPPITDVAELAQELGYEAQADVPAHSTDRLLTALTATPMRPDDIARAFDLDIVQTIRTLGTLESLGHLARYPDGRYGALPR
ncbi:MAG: DNA-processing protein DprA [Anaerosomatales bacterium]|nr:DNA-processing protein DprA [Anaerosomatales bacterium]MDT8433396.1 DNA-processing protein DprA [Anaerosomatales bacterium]